MEVNRRATIHWSLQVHPFPPGDVLCGDVVLVGPVDEHGNTLKVTESLRLLLFNTSTYTVETKPDQATEWQHDPHLFDDYFEAGAWALTQAQLRPNIEGIRVVAHS